MMEHTVAQYPDRPGYFERVQGKWQGITWTELKAAVDQFAIALLQHGLQKGDCVSILAGNDLIWPIADLGTIAAGGISVGIYPTNSPDQCAYILNHSSSKFVVVDTPQQLAKIHAIQDQIPTVKTVIVKKKPTEITDPTVLAWDQFLDLGKNPGQEAWQQYQNIAHQPGLEDIAVIVYTSGTTGAPKGACLSHRYILKSSESLYHFSTSTFQELPPDLFQKHANELFVSLSFLPFCHVAERISGMYHRLYSGIPAYLVDDLSKLFLYLQEVSPQTFGGVPRFFEKIYAKIMNDVETGNGYDKASFQKAMEINKKVKDLRHHQEPVPQDLQEQYEWAEKNVYSKVRANFGSRIIVCSSGAAPIPKEVLDMFEYAGNLTILEAYGLTEFICCVFNTPQHHKVNSVGKPMSGCQIRIAEDGEILLFGPQMFSGYYKDPEATKEMIDEQGWLHTGDIGRIDEDGFLFITGRKKEFIKTSTGKKIAPLYIENLVKRNHLISNVMVYGDYKKYLVALITLNPLELMEYARVHQITYASYAQLTQHSKIQNLVTNVIAEVNTKVSTTEQIKHYAVLDHDFSVEGDEITPTGKVKRKFVSERYKDLLESLYQE